METISQDRLDQNEFGFATERDSGLRRNDGSVAKRMSELLNRPGLKDRYLSFRKYKISKKA